jgi:biotin carboxyl carrier protein
MMSARRMPPDVPSPDDRAPNGSPRDGSLPAPPTGSHLPDVTKPHRHELVIPDLDLPGVAILASQWLVELGCNVTEGDRLLEVSVGSLTVDLPAPASGVLCKLLVAEDDELRVGQVVGLIECDPG